jgi:hypothetical protein
MTVAIKNHSLCLISIMVLTILICISETGVELVMCPEYVFLLSGLLICPVVEEYGRKKSIDSGFGLSWTIWFILIESVTYRFAFLEMDISWFIFYRLLASTAHYGFYKTQVRWGYKEAVGLHCLWNITFLIIL